MRYRIKAIRSSITSRRRGNLRAKKRGLTAILPCVLPPSLQIPKCERIHIDMLFETSALPGADLSNKKKRRLRLECTRLSCGFKNAAAKLWSAIKPKKRRILSTEFLVGALCSATLITVLSASVVLLSLFWNFLAKKTEITVAQFTGLSYDAIDIPKRSEIVLNYETSNDIPAGVIIDQKPSGGAKRILRGNETLIIYLTVSAGKSFYTVDDLQGLDERDAVLKLRNLGVSTSVLYEYSSEIPSGTVMSTSPKKDERLYDGDQLLLRVSLGTKVHTVGMPDLYGLNEAQCAQALQIRGLKLGSVTYQNSPIAAGKTIEQQYPPYSQIDSGTPVNIVISLGEKPLQKLIPDLYGLTLDQAEDALASVGLVIGNVFSVTSGAPTGTIIAQAPICNSPITPFITSVDVFISS